MGLPVWRAPSPEVRDAIKADPTAPARSPIRRSSPFHVRRRARAANTPRSPRPDYFVPRPDFVLSRPHATDHAPRPRPRHSPGRPRLPPPPVPESRHYSRHANLHHDLELERMRRERHYRPVHDSMSFGSSLSFGEVPRASRALPDLTPGFAPAAAARQSRADSVAERQLSAFRSTSPHPWNAWADDGAILEDGDSDHSDNNDAVGILTRSTFGGRTIADGPLPSSSLRESWSPATTVDGLGDRERSISPIDDHWDTMLTTVAPDPLPPTADSSFASAAASASFSNSHPSSRAGSSNSNSASSSRTHLTVPSRLPTPPNEVSIRACETSDSDTASDTEAEDMPMQSDIRRRVHQYADARPPRRDRARYSRAVYERSQESTSSVSAYYEAAYGLHSTRPLHDQLDGPVEESASAEANTEDDDQELRDARAILRRLSRRPDVTDDFWASVGLTRSMADRVERIQQRERL